MRRRTFLRLGALTPAAALGRLPLAPPARAEGERGEPRGSAASAQQAAGRVAEPALDADARAILATVVDRMVDTGEPGAPSPRDVGAVERIDQLLSVSDPELVDAVRLALRAVDLWPTVVELRFRRFRSLSDPERDQSLQGWRRSSFELRRRIFYALRQLAFYGYWSDDKTWPLIGYPGPWIRSPE